MKSAIARMDKEDEVRNVPSSECSGILNSQSVTLDDSCKPYICPLCNTVTYGKNGLFSHVHSRHKRPRKKRLDEKRFPVCIGRKVNSTDDGPIIDDTGERTAVCDDVTETKRNYSSMEMNETCKMRSKDQKHVRNCAKFVSIEEKSDSSYHMKPRIRLKVLRNITTGSHQIEQVLDSQEVCGDVVDDTEGERAVSDNSMIRNIVSRCYKDKDENYNYSHTVAEADDSDNVEPLILEVTDIPDLHGNSKSVRKAVCDDLPDTISSDTDDYGVESSETIPGKSRALSDLGMAASASENASAYVSSNQFGLVGPETNYYDVSEKNISTKSCDFTGRIRRSSKQAYKNKIGLLDCADGKVSKKVKERMKCKTDAVDVKERSKFGPHKSNNSATGKKVSPEYELTPTRSPNLINRTKIKKHERNVASLRVKRKQDANVNKSTLAVNNRISSVKTVENSELTMVDSAYSLNLNSQRRACKLPKQLKTTRVKPNLKANNNLSVLVEVRSYNDSLDSSTQLNSINSLVSDTQSTFGTDHSSQASSANAYDDDCWSTYEASTNINQKQTDLEYNASAAIVRGKNAKSDSDVIVVLICPICNRATKGQKGLYEHVRDRHSYERKSKLTLDAKLMASDVDLCGEAIDTSIEDEITSEQTSGAFGQQNDVSMAVDKGNNSVRCNICLRMIKLTSRRSYDDHIQYHRRNGKISIDVGEAFAKAIDCPICFTAIPVKHDRSFMFHIYNHGRPPKNRPSVRVPEGQPRCCRFCNEVFHRRSEITRHMKTHVAERKYVCETCGSGFFKLDSLKKHDLQHTGERPYMCEKCGRTQSTYACHMRHLRTHAVERFSFECTTCPASFRSQELLDRHVTIHSDTTKKLFHCKSCGMCFEVLHKLKVHERIHTGERPYTCTVCSKGFKTKGEMKQHCRTVHKMAWEQHCKITVTPAEAKGRKSRVSKTRRPDDEVKVKAQCTICNKVLQNKSHLAIHLRIHTDARPFPCEHCNRSFRRKDNLRAHERIRHKEKLGDSVVKYTCPLCSIVLSYKQVLQRHMWTHGVYDYLKPERTNRCETCGEAFVTKTQLKKHMKLHVKDDNKEDE